MKHFLSIFTLFAATVIGGCAAPPMTPYESENAQKGLVTKGMHILNVRKTLSGYSIRGGESSYGKFCINGETSGYSFMKDNYYNAMFFYKSSKLEYTTCKKCTADSTVLAIKRGGCYYSKS